MRPDGRMAGYIVHTPAGLSAAAEQRVEELVPMDALADGSPVELAERAGFSVVTCDDVTDQFRTTCDAILRARERHEAEGRCPHRHRRGLAGALVDRGSQGLRAVPDTELMEGLVYRHVRKTPVGSEEER